MDNEAFIKEIKVGFGVMVLGFVRNLFLRLIRRLTIFAEKLECALEKRLQADAIA